MSNRVTCYNPQPIAFEKSDGIWLIDNKGEKYLDSFSGIAVSALGHNHPNIVKAIHAQSSLLHTSNAVEITWASKLADKLCNLTNMPQIFFANSGAEANETAIKIARLYGHQKNIEKPKIIVTERAFHGRSMGTLSATGIPSNQVGFEPLLEGFIRVPYDDIEAIEALRQDKEICALLIEPILGNSGIIMPQPGYLKALRDIAKTENWLLMIDEVQTGIGRTGRWFAYEHEQSIDPDVVTLAKALGGGIPIGACLMANHAKDLLKPGSHGSTFGGNPFATRVAFEVLSTIETDELINNSRVMGEYLIQALSSQLNIPEIKGIRGKGLFVGVEFDRAVRPLCDYALSEKLVLNVSSANTIRLAPALTINQNEIDILVERLKASVKSWLQDGA